MKHANRSLKLGITLNYRNVYRMPVLAEFCKVVSKDPVGPIFKGKNNRLDEDKRTTCPRDNSTEE